MQTKNFGIICILADNVMSVPFQGSAAGIVCFLYTPRFQEKTSAGCLNLYPKELRKCVSYPELYLHCGSISVMSNEI